MPFYPSSVLVRKAAGLLFVATLLCSPVAFTAPQAKVKSTSKSAASPKLTLEAISRDAGKWAGTAPTQIRWSEDGKKLYFNWNPERADRAEMYELEVLTPGATPRKVTDEEKRWLSSNPGVRNKAETLKVYAFRGDNYLHDLRTGKTRQITNTSDTESNPRFSFDQTGILFARNDNLLEWVIETGETRQLSDFRRGRDPDEKPKLSKQDEYLEKQQLEMFEWLQKQDKDEKEQKERTKKERGPFPDPTYLKENESVGDLDLTPDRKYVTFLFTDRSESSRVKIPEIPKYVTKSGYSEMERLVAQAGLGGGRVKVGATQPKQKLGILNPSDGKIRYVEIPIEKREYHFQSITGNPGPGAGGAQFLEWSDDAKSVFIILNSNDHKDRWIALLDVETAKANIIDTEHDDAWVTWLTGGGAPYAWLPDNKTIWMRNERDGYFHIYTLPMTGGKPTALTSGKWEVLNAQLSKDKSTFFLTTSETHPSERNFYTMPVSGGPRSRVTTADGVNAVVLSPDESKVAISFAGPDGPGDLYLIDRKPGAKMARLTDSYTDEFKSYRWQKFEVVTIPDADNNLLYARLYKPEKPNPLHPAVIYVHGAGYAQSVFRNWGGFNTTPFFNVLLDAGYTVLDLDYRGSAGYGRDCRTAVYRNMGGKDIDSAVAAAKWLADSQGVDPRRIGIYGGSYGGFFTLMALFKHPAVFAAGASLYPVTDWAHYNHPYTSNILNLPADDDEAYRRSSPIHYANGLSDRLLILHGMFDRNVHYQDTVRLTQKLIELKKSGWELASMPIEDHGWQNEYSRLDSNRRIFTLFEETLKRSLPPLPKTKASGTKSAAAGSGK